MSALIDKLVSGVDFGKLLSNKDMARVSSTKSEIVVKANELFSKYSSFGFSEAVTCGISVFVSCNMYAFEPLTRNYFNGFGINIGKPLNELLAKGLIDETFVMYSSPKKY
ncbi:MAG TPA: hypothetical protein VI790_00910 [Candidatus Nanoarchaeia archaeon]|nr:hypothetical protein [Candidatus Nanoarchaeia archaeon]